MDAPTLKITNIHAIFSGHRVPKADLFLWKRGRIQTLNRKKLLREAIGDQREDRRADRQTKHLWWWAFHVLKVLMLIVSITTFPLIYNNEYIIVFALLASERIIS